MERHMKTKRYFSFALLAIVALALSATIAGAQDAKVIKIASQGPLSGGLSQSGISMRNAAQLAIEQLSKPLTDMGYKVEFVPFDDQANADQGVANAQQIVADPAILAVIGHFNSGVAIPSSEVYDKNNLVMISPANTNPTVTDRGLKTVNRVCGRDDTQGAVGAEFAASLEGIKTVYVLNNTNAYGLGVATFFRDDAEKLGLQILGFDGTTETSNFDSVLQPILALNPDMIYFGGEYAQSGPFINQARAAGFKGVFMGPDGFAGSDFAKLGGDAAIGTYFTTAAAPTTQYPAAAQFEKDYDAEFKEPTQ